MIQRKLSKLRYVLKDKEGFNSEEKVVVISNALASLGKIDAIQIRHLPKEIFVENFSV